jgi:hypothetical protein
MHPRMLNRYGWEIELQCQLVLKGADELEAALAEPRSDDWIVRAWMGLQTILTSAANIAKLCWGATDKRPASTRARKPLRDALDIPEHSPLNNQRVRNRLEHYDEWLDRWADAVLAGEQPSFYISRTIGPSITPIAKRQGKQPPPMLGNYDPQTGRFEFWDKEILIPRLVEAARELLPRAHNLARGQ